MTLREVKFTKELVAIVQKYTSTTRVLEKFNDLWDEEYKYLDDGFCLDLARSADSWVKDYAASSEYIDDDLHGYFLDRIKSYVFYRVCE